VRLRRPRTENQSEARILAMALSPDFVAVNEVRVHLTLVCSMDDDREDARPLSLNGGAAVTSRIEKDGAGWEVGCHL